MSNKKKNKNQPMQNNTPEKKEQVATKEQKNKTPLDQLLEQIKTFEQKAQKDYKWLINENKFNFEIKAKQLSDKLYRKYNNLAIKSGKPELVMKNTYPWMKDKTDLFYYDAYDPKKPIFNHESSIIIELPEEIAEQERLADEFEQQNTPNLVFAEQIPTTNVAQNIDSNTTIPSQEYEKEHLAKMNDKAANLAKKEQLKMQKYEKKKQTKLEAQRKKDQALILKQKKLEEKQKRELEKEKKEYDLWHQQMTKKLESLKSPEKEKFEEQFKAQAEKKLGKYEAKRVNLLNKPHTGPHLIEFEDPKNIIELRNVRKIYTNGYVATEILKGIDLDIRIGDFVVILGPSGSGKTTLMNIIAGLDRATDGVVNVAGYNLITFNDAELTSLRRDNIGYVFQQYGLLPNLTVKENIEIGQDLQRDKTKRIPIDEVLETFGLKQHASKFPNQLSGGQQQRVSIARSIAKNPKILFGDEPTGAIDEEMSKVVLSEFVNINKTFNTTVIIVTHNPIFTGLGSLVVKIKDGLINESYRNANPKTVEELPWGQE